MLAHRQQLGEVGCLYFALYALTGDEQVLEHAADVSDARWQARLAGWGLMPFAFWVTGAAGPPTPPEFWMRQRAQFRESGGISGAPLLVSILGNSPDWLHAVAVLLPLDDSPVAISDSNFPELLFLSWEQFLGSDYARAHRVEMLGPLLLDAYPPDLRTP